MLARYGHCTVAKWSERERTVVESEGGWTMETLMEQLFGAPRLIPLAEDVAEARERAELLRASPDLPEARAQLGKLAREIVRATEDRRLREEGELAWTLATLARQDEWDHVSIERMVAGFTRLDHLMRRRVEACSPDVRRWDLRKAG